MKKILIVFVLISSFFFSGSYYEAVEKQLEIAEKSNFSDLLSPETTDLLDKMEIEGLSSEKLVSFNINDILKLFAEIFSAKIKEPFKAIFSITSCAIICSLIQNFCEKFSQTQKTINVVTALSASGVFLLPIKNILDYSSKVIEESSDFMLAFIPVYSSAITATGNFSSALGYRTLMLGAVTIISRIASEIIAPLISIYIAMCVATSVSDIDIGELSKSLKNFAVWVLTASATVFSGILGLGTLVSSQGNIAFLKTAKLFVGTTVPIVGGTVSEALTTIKSCLEITKNILGSYGVVVIAVIFLPAIVSLLSWKICLSVSSIISGILENKSLSALLSSASSVMGIMLALVVITAVMLIFSVSIMLLTGGG